MQKKRGMRSDVWNMGQLGVMGTILMIVLYSVGTVEVELDVSPPSFSPYITLSVINRIPHQPALSTIYHLVVIEIRKGRMLITECPSMDRTPLDLPTRFNLDGVFDVDYHLA